MGLIKKADRCLFLSVNDDVIQDKDLVVVGRMPPQPLRVQLPRAEERFVSHMRIVDAFLDFAVRPIFQENDLDRPNCPESDNMTDQDFTGVAGDHCSVCFVRRFFMLRNLERNYALQNIAPADIMLSLIAEEGRHRLTYTPQNGLNALSLIVARNPGDDLGRRLHDGCLKAATEFGLTPQIFGMVMSWADRPTSIEQFRQPTALAEFLAEVRGLRQAVSDKLTTQLDRFTRGGFVVLPRI
ncbi:MAG: hypothetical protein LBJ03_03595 [Holosporales bacterium]|jgi:hypothetical protein|nr:hypothetical protein [Holosporales bacterium]